MLNAHLRFGSLTYYRRTEKTTTHFQLHLDRFIGEVAADPPLQARAHFLSVIGSETQISAINAAIHMEEAFTLEAAGGSNSGSSRRQCTMLSRFDPTHRP